MKYIGVDAECTRWDKLIYMVAISKTGLLLGSFAVMTTLGLTMKLSDRQWSLFHQCFLWFFIGTSFVIAIWLSVGGLRDAAAMFKDLKAAKRDYADDGTVKTHYVEESDVTEDAE